MEWRSHPIESRRGYLTVLLVLAWGMAACESTPSATSLPPPTTVAAQPTTAAPPTSVPTKTPPPTVAPTPEVKLVASRGDKDKKVTVAEEIAILAQVKPFQSSS